MPAQGSDAPRLRAPYNRGPMNTPSLRRLAPLALAAAFAVSFAPVARADSKLPGEASELTPEVRTAAQKLVDVIVKG